jgi:hypothetical protein
MEEVRAKARERDEEQRKDLVIELEDARMRASERAEEQRKELVIELDTPD